LEPSRGATGSYLQSGSWCATPNTCRQRPRIGRHCARIRCPPLKDARRAQERSRPMVRRLFYVCRGLLVPYYADGRRKYWYASKTSYKSAEIVTSSSLKSFSQVRWLETASVRRGSTSSTLTVT